MFLGICMFILIFFPLIYYMGNLKSILMIGISSHEDVDWPYMYRM